MSELYAALAKSAQTQRKTRHDSEFFNPNQQGSMVIHEFKDISKGLKKTAIIVGEILESHPTVAGALAQPKGAMVKKIYSLSKFAFHLDQMMNDILDIVGVDPKEMDEASIKQLFSEVFEGKSLRGVVVNFKTKSEEFNKKTKEKRTTPITSVYFSVPRGPVDEEGVPTGDNVNTDERIKARAAKLPSDE